MICHLYWFNKILFGQYPVSNYRWGNQTTRILGRGTAQSAVATQMQMKQDENAKGTKLNPTKEILYLLECELTRHSL